MIKENITHLDNRLAVLERKIRETRHMMARFREAQQLHKETALLAPDAELSLATALAVRAVAIQEAYQNVTQAYSAKEALEE